MSAMALPDTWEELIALVGDGEPASSEVPVPSGPVVLDGGVWLARSVDDQRREWGRCGEQIGSIARSERVTYDQLAPRSKAVFGVDDAARWTLGRAAAGPVSRYRLPVTGEAITYELGFAVEVVRQRAEDWEKAVGAYVWLRWLTGEDDAITYPLW